MTADLLIENFETLAAAPGGVPKLRRLILSLAVRGELVSNALPSKIASSHVANAPHPIPQSWRWQPLGDLVEILDSQRVPVSSVERNRRTSGKDPSQLTPYYGATQQTGWIDSHLFDEELLLLGEDGVPFDEPYKSKAYLITGKSWVNNHAHVLRGCVGMVVNRYLVHWLNVFDYEGTISGTTRSKLTQGKMIEIPVPLPPLPEQRRIVAKVDELMTLCNALEAQQEAAQKTQSALTHSALHHLTTATTPADFSSRWNFISRNFRSLEARPKNVAELRKAILRLAVEGWLIPGHGATHWPTHEFHTIAQISGGVTKGRKLVGRKMLELPYLRVANVQRGFLDLGVVKNIEIAADELNRYRLQPNDVLIVEGGDWDKVGRAAIWRGEISVCLHQNHIFRARVDPNIVHPEWIQLALNSPLGREYFEGASKQTTNLASINMTQLRAFPVPLPPIDYQDKALAKVDELMKLCDALEAGLARERAAADWLFDAVVARLMETAA